MASFIEIPQLLHSSQREVTMYVNVDSILLITEEPDGQTRVATQDFKATTYVPLGVFLNALSLLNVHPGVHGWARAVKDDWLLQLAQRLEQQAGAR